MNWIHRRGSTDWKLSGSEARQQMSGEDAAALRRLRRDSGVCPAPWSGVMSRLGTHIVWPAVGALVSFQTPYIVDD